MAEQIDWSKMLGAGYFRDRTVLITGASSGIGRDIAMSLSRMGAQVAMLARRTARTERMLAESGESGVSGLSPVRFGRKERRISRGVFCPLQNIGKMWRLVGGEK
jgi:NADPH:quinone reductase-like Zn-dependent oxidoreductase